MDMYFDCPEGDLPEEPLAPWEVEMLKLDPEDVADFRDIPDEDEDDYPIEYDDDSDDYPEDDEYVDPREWEWNN